MAESETETEARGEVCSVPLPAVEIPWPGPTPEMLQDPRFEIVWQVIRTWDINVPGAYEGYCGATGNHVRAILDALFHHQLTKFVTQRLK